MFSQRKFPKWKPKNCPKTVVPKMEAQNLLNNSGTKMEKEDLTNFLTMEGQKLSKKSGCPTCLTPWLEDPPLGLILFQYANIGLVLRPRARPGFCLGHRAEKLATSCNTYGKHSKWKTQCHV